MDFVEAEINQIINNSLAEDNNMSSINNETTNDTKLLNTSMNIDISVNNNNIYENTSIIDNTIEDTASIEIFNTALHQYLTVNEEINSLMLAVKQRNDIKRKLGDTLSNYLKAKQIKKVNLDGSYKGKRLEVEVKTSNIGFNKTSVTEALLSELQDETELFDKIMRAISKTSVLKEVWKLKVTEEKAARNATSGGKKNKGGRQFGTSMADAAALIDA